MMLGFLEGTDLLIVLAIVALLFGSTQLPKLARSLGSASKEFKKGSEEGAGENATKPAPKASPPHAATPQPASPPAPTVVEVVEVVEVKRPESQAS